MVKSELPTLLGDAGKQPRNRQVLILLIATFGLLLWTSPVRSIAQYCTNLVYHVGCDADTSPIKWTKCDDVILCASLDVPLDYQNPANGTATLALAKYPATSKAEARLGTLFLNPGGPGGSGVQLIYTGAPKISELFDGRYDIVSWDPRGINSTTPRIECFSEQIDQDIYYIHTAQEAPLSIGNLTSAADMAVLTHELKAEDARNEALVNLCVEHVGADNLKFVGTATVVRDLELLARTLEGDKPVNYWGFSYGTVVGSYFTNMFPDRVGRVAIDGVVNPDIWTTLHTLEWFPEFYNSTYATYQGFLKTCVKAGPERCALAREGLTASELNKSIEDWLARLYDRPLPVPYARRPGILTKGHVTGFLFIMTYTPRRWAMAAEFLDEAMSGNGTQILNFLQRDVDLSKAHDKAQTALSFAAVTCTDAPPYTDEERERDIEEMIEALKASFEVAPDFASVDFPDLCHLWPVEASERFTGPWNHTLSNDILVLGNSYDPITPLINAQHVHEWQKNSVLVHQDGFGHCTLAQTSLCTLRVLRSYFLNGTLPDSREVFCPVDEPLYPAPGLADDVSAWFSAELSEGERRLMEVARDLGREMEMLSRMPGRRGGRLW